MESIWTKFGNFVQKRLEALGMNDLKGNYDRVVHTVAILVLVSFGLHYGTAKLLFEVLQSAEHCIKTGYGTLQPLYGGDTEDPEMGLGQGNGLAPTVWCLISSKMMECMKNRGHGINLRASLSTVLISFVCFAFVDDTDIPVTALDRFSTGKDVGPLFQKAIDDWAGIVRVTGGELESKKLHVTIADF